MKQEEPIPNIDAYIADFPVETREKLETIRGLVHALAPDVIETIKYRMPTFMLTKNLVYFAAFKKHIGLFAVPVEHPDFATAVADFKTGSGSIQFPNNRPLPLELITALLEARIRQHRDEPAL